eukprot:823569_1
MAASFLLIVHSLIYVVNSMDWRNIWTDDCDTQGSWACHPPLFEWFSGDHDLCRLAWFSDDPRGDDLCHCQNGGICHRVCQNAYIENSVSISAYVGRPLRLSFYVHLQSEGVHEALPNDRCRMRFAYDNEDYDIDNYDWQCGDMKSTR